MEIQELKMLLALAERRNFTDAAYDCAISQSSLSKHLAKVESDLGGVRLFDRSTRPIAPTKEGEVFLAAAQQMSEIYDRMLLQLEDMRTQTRARLRIGSVPVMGRLGHAQGLPPVAARGGRPADHRPAVARPSDHAGGRRD